MSFGDLHQKGMREVQHAFSSRYLAIVAFFLAFLALLPGQKFIHPIEPQVTIEVFEFRDAKFWYKPQPLGADIVDGTWTFEVRELPTGIPICSGHGSHTYEKRLLPWRWTPSQMALSACDLTVGKAYGASIVLRTGEVVNSANIDRFVYTEPPA